VKNGIQACLFAATLSGCATALPPASKEVVFSKDAPAAIGPYSQGIKMGNMVLLAVQGPTDVRTGQPAGPGIEAQTRQALENLKAVLAAQGLGMDDIVSTTVYMKDIDDFAKMNAVYGGYFKDKPPARATVQVARLPRDALVQISAIAAR
jgi:2-iminobutanoate/2-iminopropanoate deaminase